MERETDRWQQRDEEQRMQITLSVLREASTRALTLEERSFLASELGLWKEWMQHTSNYKEMKHAANW